MTEEARPGGAYRVDWVVLLRGLGQGLCESLHVQGVGSEGGPPGPEVGPGGLLARLSEPPEGL